MNNLVENLAYEWLKIMRLKKIMTKKETDIVVEFAIWIDKFIAEEKK